MIRGGDELSQTQDGNNNVYCQDNELSWLDWDLTPAQQDFLDFARQVVHLRQAEPVLRRRRFFQGRRIRGAGIKDISWFDPKGQEMADEAWNAPSVRSLGVRLSGDAIDEHDECGRRVTGSSLFLLLNAADNEIPFTLPATPAGWYWEEAINSANGTQPPAPLVGGVVFPLPARSLAVLVLRRDKRRRTSEERAEADAAAKVKTKAKDEQPATAAPAGRGGEQATHDQLVRSSR
jgi:glycogen operon protein